MRDKKTAIIYLVAVFFEIASLDYLLRGLPRLFVDLTAVLLDFLLRGRPARRLVEVFFLEAALRFGRPLLFVVFLTPFLTDLLAAATFFAAARLAAATFLAAFLATL